MARMSLVWILSLCAIVPLGCGRKGGDAATASGAGEGSAAVVPPSAATPTAAADEPAGAAERPRADIPGFVRPVGPVATVNGRPIPAARFNDDFDRLVGTGARIPAGRIRRIAQNILDKLIDNELREQAIREAKIELTEAEFESAYAEYTNRYIGRDGRFDERQFRAHLERSRLTVDGLKAQIREQRLHRKLVERTGNLRISDADLKAFYDKNPAAWGEPESRDVRPIMVRIQGGGDEPSVQAALEKANEAWQALRKGGDFEQISKEYSDMPLSPVHLTRSSPEQEMVKAAFALKVGEVSKPIRTKWGWYVLRLIEKNDQRVRGFDEVRDEIAKTMRARKFYLEDRRIVQLLRKKAAINETLPF